MAGSVNKVILVGNLGKDPEVRRMQSGDTVVNFSIVTSATRGKPPAHWTCIKFPRLEGFSAVAPRQWAISEPYNKCMNINVGFCCLWTARRKPEEQA